MVLYFSSNVVDPAAMVYMGKDKFENEDLIKYGWPEDVWFHVDKLSSAHVYLRLNHGQSWESIPQELLDDLAQLVKANSIEGNKKNDITIIYTPWANLMKRGDMATGQVSFHNPRQVKRVHVKQRENAIVNRLNKTKREEYPDLRQQKSERDRDEKRELKRAFDKKHAQELKVIKERKSEKEARSYDAVFKNAEKRGKKKNMVVEDLFGDGDDDDSDDAVPTRHADDFADFF
ncbi:Coiled-coil domain-containing protein 25 [Linderina macrospora]|uniref:Coiled-coil domain-containing protein 25 n=1 Tax=Linderina macrospora TaxID=4868 RepID=A0ACC1JDU4_9FUNG|nr:Coiled-coil domain-containing protein 25 [Linderina macrospora]